MLVCDVDHFKRINDVRGHEVGDRTLARFGGLLRDMVRPAELAIRLGGEEFALVLRAGAEEALTAAECLRVAVRRHFEPELPELAVSVGVATAGRDGDDAAALLSAADKALYAAKRLGRDRCLAYDPELVVRVMAAGDPGGSPRGELLAPVLLLAETLDLRDPSTARHSQTVGRYAEALARALDWPPGARGADAHRRPPARRGQGRRAEATSASTWPARPSAPSCAATASSAPSSSRARACPTSPAGSCATTGKSAPTAAATRAGSAARRSRPRRASSPWPTPTRP